MRKETQRLMKLNDENKPHFILEPYITIARKLQPWQYEKGWLEYSNRNFTGRFIADGMLLLKRPLDEMKIPGAAKIRISKFAGDNEAGRIIYVTSTVIHTIMRYVDVKDTLVRSVILFTINH